MLTVEKFFLSRSDVQLKFNQPVSQPVLSLIPLWDVLTNPFNLLAPELFLLILSHPVYKMLIIQEPNTLQL